MKGKKQNLRERFNSFPRSINESTGGNGHNRTMKKGTSHTNTQKRCQQSALPDPCSQTTYELAIITKDYPTTLFKWQHFDAIQTAIFNELEVWPGPVPIINLGNINNVGAIPVTCEGMNAVNFLYYFDGKYIKGNEIEIIDAVRLPKLLKMAWQTRTIVCKDPKRLLRMLQRCNPKLRTELWRIVDTKVGAQFVQSIVFVDCVSASYMKSKNYNIPDGLGRSIFKVLYHRKTKQTKYVNPGGPFNDINCNPQQVNKTGSDSLQSEVKGHKDQEHKEPVPVGDPNGSIFEIQQPIVTVDLTEDSCSDYDGSNDENEILGPLS